MRILILTAFQQEFRNGINFFDNLVEKRIAQRRCLYTKINDHEVYISTTGIGTFAAASNTTAICQALDPDLIFLCGFAGGLEINQRIGDLLISNKIIGADLYDVEQLLQTPYSYCLADSPTQKMHTTEYSINPYLVEVVASTKIERCTTGALVSSNTYPLPLHFIQGIKNFGCSAIDMESITVFKAAEYYDIPVITIRAISNLIDDFGNHSGTEPSAFEICSQRMALFLMDMMQRIDKLLFLSEKKQQTMIAELVTKFKLSKHPEGGWFRQTFKSTDTVKAEGKVLERYQGERRSAATSIIFLLANKDYSAWHTVQSDETWLFHDGDPLLLRIINPANEELSEIMLGANEGCLQYTVKAGYVFSAESLGRYTLTGCVVTPGFEYKDFKLISKEEFSKQFPKHISLLRFIVADN